MHSSMTLRILLPYTCLLEVTDVLRVVCETPGGHFGLLPNRLDCAAELVPGILVYQTVVGPEQYVALDSGALTKMGNVVNIAVRTAVVGAELGALRQTVADRFEAIAQREQEQRISMFKVERELLREARQVDHGR
ncbi:MAG: F0F1 ATP synthase subunit epsilon [Gammaproteobacteria bacterium]|nr:F0F1 ATP synthase subunit epsilon [Gammaproteobacteria bacterium]